MPTARCPACGASFRADDSGTAHGHLKCPGCGKDLKFTVLRKSSRARPAAADSLAAADMPTTEYVGSSESTSPFAGITEDDGAGADVAARLHRAVRRRDRCGSIARLFLWTFFLFVLVALEIKLRLWGNLQDQLAIRLMAWGFLFLVFFALDRLLATD